MIRLGDIYLLKPKYASETKLPLKGFIGSVSLNNRLLFNFISLDSASTNKWMNEQELNEFYVYSHSAQEVIVLRIEDKYYLKGLDSLEKI